MKENFEKMWSEWKSYNEKMFEMWKKMADISYPQTNTEKKEVLPEVEDWIEKQEAMLSFYKKWFEASKEMMKLYKPDVMTSMLPNEWADYSEKWTSFWKDSFGKMETFGLQPYEQFQSLMDKTYQDFFPNNSVKDTFGRLMGTMDVYNKLHGFWLEMIKKMPTKENQETWEKFMKETLNSYSNINELFSQTFIPEQVKSVMVIPMENIKTIQAEIIKFYRPWLEEGGELQKKLLLALQGDRNAFMEFQSEWRKMFEETVSKFTNIPAVGSNREIIEKTMKSIESYTNYLFTLNEFMGSLNHIGINNMEKVLTKLSEMVEEGEAPTSFKEFYKLWSKTNEEAYLELFATESFSKMLAETVDAGLRFKKVFNDMIQDQMATLPIPTRRELDVLEKNFYLLRKQVKAQARAIEELEEKVEELEARGGRI
ncbi:MAG: poly(R)-hydroxyalkanoic acid synthase subunit PhaE [Peptococcia bacterium]